MLPGNLELGSRLVSLYEKEKVNEVKLSPLSGEGAYVSAHFPFLLSPDFRNVVVIAN